jgi:hypothetical protein
MYAIASTNTTRGLLALSLAAVLAGCGSSSSDNTAKTSTPTATPTAILPTATPTAKAKHHKKHHHKAKAKSTPVPTPSGTAKAKATVPKQKPVAKSTPLPNVFDMTVRVTTAGLSISPSSLPAGRNLEFVVSGSGVGHKAEVQVVANGTAVGSARILKQKVRMQIPKLSKGTVVLKVTGAKHLGTTSKSVPVH